VTQLRRDARGQSQIVNCQIWQLGSHPFKHHLRINGVFEHVGSRQRLEKLQHHLERIVAHWQRLGRNGIGVRLLGKRSIDHLIASRVRACAGARVGLAEFG
jgi:hypothetical protein